MIQVENLRKVYGEFEALRNISFNIERGEVVGFLGPNGAGKTTTLRILTGFIPATSGKVVVAGFDVFDDSLEVRRRLGYLPESVPLYTEMRVEEYLKFRAALKRIPLFERQANVDRVIEQCWLSANRTRIIGHLSKGFRQRVGLADALLGSPQVLILDEPTVGLDPNQVRETRSLIKSLSEVHTVILSTHILHEVEMICSRIIIIHDGLIVADSTQQGLVESMSDASRLLLELRGNDVEPVNQIVASVEGIDKYYCSCVDGIIKIEIVQHPTYDLRETLAIAFAKHGLVLREIRSERFTLEDIFANLTSDKYASPAQLDGTEGADDVDESHDGELNNESVDEPFAEPVVQDVKPAMHSVDSALLQAKADAKRAETSNGAHSIDKDAAREEGGA